MELIKPRRVLGLMSGSSLNGVEAAVISTDGVDVFDFGPFTTVPYSENLQDKLRSFSGHRPEDFDTETFSAAEAEFTDFHVSVTKDIIADYDEHIDLIGFFGYTLLHSPQEHYTCQFGNPATLAAQTHIPVVSRFCYADILAGGQGAPLSAVFHGALGMKIKKPTAFLNIDGISSLTWLGDNGELIAFDIGAGIALVNDWVLRHGGMHMDYNGRLAVTGKVHPNVLSSLLRHKYLAAYPPKAADRNLFKDKFEHLEGLSLEDGAATATAFIAEEAAYSLSLYVPEMPKVVIVCGAGANNPTLMRFLRQKLENIEVRTAEEEGWNGMAMEAQACAFLAARRLHFMPATYPFTTGVAAPCICGEVFE